MKLPRRAGKSSDRVLAGLALTAVAVLSLVACRNDERLGRPGLEVGIRLDEETWARLRTAKGVREFREEPHLFLIRFGSGRELRGAFTVRGETSLRRAFQTKRPERLNYSVELPQPVPFAPGVRLDRLYLMNMIFDPHLFEMRFCYTLLAELGLFPAHNQLVDVTVNGDRIGLELLLERPRDALLRTRPDLSSIHRRSYDEQGRRGLYEPVFRRFPGAGSTHVESLRRAVSALRGDELVTELDRILDLDGYLRWLAFNSLVRNADSYDEVFFYLAPTRDHPGGRLEVMAWDYDDVMRPAPAHPRLALDDPLMFAAESPLDRRIQQEPALYERYKEVLRDLLENRLRPEKLRLALTSVREEVEGIDLGLDTEAATTFLERRRAAMTEFEAALLARHAELLQGSAPETAVPDRATRRRTKRAGRESQTAPNVLWTDLRPDPAAVTATTGARFELIHPTTRPAAGTFPVVVRALDGAGRVDRGISGWIELEVRSATGTDGVDLLLRRGVGSTAVPAGDLTAPLEIGVAGLPERRAVGLGATATRRLSGPLSGDDLRWLTGEVVQVDGDVVVGPGDTLVVEPGVVVLLENRANLLVEGDFESRGSRDLPVLFRPAEPEAPWGGIVHAGTAAYRWTFLTGGGGDPHRRYGHSRSQAMIFGEKGSRLELSQVFLLDSPGKGFGGLATELEMRDSLVSRTDMGGELLDSRALVERSWFLDFPDLGAVFRDDDNDALYLRGRHPEASVIDESVFIGGLDDGIDHFGATVEIRRSWIQGFSHEGVAASVGGRVRVEDTVVTECEQGLEAGVGAPRVEARHVLLFGNDVGVRYGDAYGGRYAGTIEVTDSVIVENRKHALRNWLHKTGGPAPSGIGLFRSLVDEQAWDHGEGNVVGAAVLTEDLLLAPDSPGRGIAANGADPGLSTPRPAAAPGDS